MLERRERPVKINIPNGLTAAANSVLRVVREAT